MAYNPYEWTNGELITDVKLNHIENGIGSNSEDIEALRGAYGTPLVASSAADMTDTNKIYVYVGNESGYTNGHWYYYNGTAWADGGAYNATALVTDATLSIAGEAADAKATGDAVNGINSALRIILDNYTTQAPFVVIGQTPYSTSLIEGKVLNRDGVVANASGTAYKITNYIPVEYGKFVFFTYTRARWNNKNYAFYDENYNVIATNEKSASSTTTLENYIVQVPEGAAYFVLGIDINSVSGEPDIKVAVVTMWRENQTPVPSDITYNIGPDDYAETQLTGTITSSAFLTYAGTIFRNGTLATYTINEISVEYGEVLNIYNARALYSYPQYAFFDVAGQMIQMHRDNDSNLHDYKFIPVPFGAVKIIVSGANTSNPSCTKITDIYGNGYKWKNIKWTAVGDSITEENNRATKHYFDYIAEKTGITVVNEGKSGTGYMKPYGDNLPFYQRTDQIPTDSDVITIFGSVNDANEPLGTPTDTGTTTVCGCINSTIDAIRTRIVGANLGIITPLPTETYPTTTEDNNLDLYANAIVAICKLKGVPCLDMYHESNMTPWESAFKTAYYTHDDGNGTHPDENGQKLFAPRIKAFLETLLL